MQAYPHEFVGIAVSGTKAAVHKSSILPGLAGYKILCRAGRGLCSGRRHKEKCENKKNHDSNPIAANGPCALNCDTPLSFFQLSVSGSFHRATRRACPSTKVSVFGEGTVAGQKE
jgi:hypothetical protein